MASNDKKIDTAGLILKSGMQHTLSVGKYSIRLLDEKYEPVADTQCTCTFSDGTSVKRTSDKDGWITVRRMSTHEYIDVTIAGRSDDGDRRVYFTGAIRQDDPIETIKRLLANMGFYNDDDAIETTLRDFMETHSLDLMNTGMSELIATINEKYQIFIQEKEADDPEVPISDSGADGERT
jgi:hypothetical protein